MTDPQPIDRLMDQARIKGASRMISDNTSPETISREQAQDVIGAVLNYIAAKGISRSKIANSLGIGAPTLGSVLNQKYTGCWQEIVLDLDRWLEDQAKRDAAPRVTDFVWTRVAEEIRTVADVAATLRTIGLVYGPTTSGMGKTTALEAIVADTPGAIMISVEKMESSTTAMLKSIGRALRIADSSPRLYAKIKEKLGEKQADGGTRLLIVDQVHNLCGKKDDTPLFTLCDIHDATQSPQLWAGTIDVVQYLDRGLQKGRETLSQISRRIGIARDLMARTRGQGGGGEPLFTVEEIRKIFSKGKMRLAADAARHLCHIANLVNSGSLGTCKNLVRLVTQLHAASGATLITADMLRSAHKILASSRVFSRIEMEIEEFAAPMAKVG